MRRSNRRARLGALALAASPWAVASAGAAPEPRPNILLIVSDDQGYGDFGFMGHPVIRTPHLDELARASAVFPNGYVPTALCRASLASLLTGRYAHEHGLCFNDPPPGTTHDATQSVLPHLPTIPRDLATAGYVSLQTGKYWEGHYSSGGFTHGMTLGGREGGAGLAIGRVTLDPIRSFLEEHDGRSPWLIYFAPMLPHKPHDPPAPFRRPYERLSLEAPVLRYYASVSWFDAIVGELLGLLREKGRAERTLVVFLVDNGWAPRRDDVPRAAPRTKNSPFEGGVRTPLLLHWPGRVRPGRREDLVSTIDVFPTLLEAAGRPPRPELPGVSLWPAATGEASVPRDAVMGAIYLHTARAVQPPAVNLLYRWIRQGAYKLIVPAQGTAAPAERDPQLFDLSADPAERRNLAARPSHRARLKTLRARLDAWWNPDPGSTP